MMGIIYLCIKKCCVACANLVTFKVVQLPKIRTIGLALLVIILAHGMFDTPFFKNDLAMIFWMIVAVVLVPADEKKS